MEKRKVFAVIMSAILALSLTACGTVTVTTAQPEPQPAAEVETPTPTPVEEPEVTPEPTKEPEEEVVEEPATEEPAAEEVATEESVSEESEAPAVEITPMDALLDSNMGEYISDGVFDAVKFYEDTKASDVRVGEHSLTYIYDDWFIQTGNESKDSSIGYIVVGVGSDFDTGNGVACKYSYLFPSGNDISVADKITISIESVIHLQDIFDSISKNGLDAAPDAVGTNFKPCDSADETIQY